MKQPRNGLSTNLMTYFHAMLKDVAWLYPRRSGWNRDLSRTVHELAINGSRFLTIDLPALCKHFDRCLARGQYTPSGLPYGSLKRGTQVPRLFQDLYLLVFDVEGKLRHTPSVEAIQALRTLMLSAKRLRLECQERRVQDALSAFLAIEDSMADPTLQWSADQLPSPDDDVYDRLHYASDMLIDERGRCPRSYLFATANSEPLGPERRELLAQLQRVCDVVASSFGSFNPNDLKALPKHGPGVTSELGRWDDKYHFPSWPVKLEHTFPYDVFGVPNWNALDGREGQTVVSEDESPSRLISVPKTQKTPRLIAAEPTSHQWIQQLLWKELEARLKQTPLANSIHFRDQSHNQRLAREGSVDGSLATIDLSAASDRLSCWVVERAFRRNPGLLKALHASRTRRLSYSIGRREGQIGLRKFAPMGSAVTFPVQSIFYACVAIAASLKGRVTSASVKRCASRISVFGDDIIAPTSAVEDLVWLLEYLGFRVNTDKTFTEGNFRESCGAEWFCGNDVSVPYLLEVPRYVTQSLCGAAVASRNNFYRRGYWNTARWLGTIYLGKRESAFQTVPIGDVRFGLESCVAGVGPLRFNRRLHTFEERCYVPIARNKKTLRDGWNALMHWFISEPAPETNFDSKLLRSAHLLWRWGWKSPSTTPDYSVVVRRMTI